MQSGGLSTGRSQWSGHDGGTQTEIRQSHGGYDNRREPERKAQAGGGEVRVIVQPIQPVFYMPRQSMKARLPSYTRELCMVLLLDEGGASTTSMPQIGPGPAIQQSASGAPNVVYVPRNVYVPVIKPVFVPRERK